jgi:hypothetical protein
MRPPYILKLRGTELRPYVAGASIQERWTDSMDDAFLIGDDSQDGYWEESVYEKVPVELDSEGAMVIRNITEEDI